MKEEIKQKYFEKEEPIHEEEEKNSWLWHNYQ